MRLFLYPEKDSIANKSVKTPLNSVDFTIFKSTFILAECDLGFKVAVFAGHPSISFATWI